MKRGNGWLWILVAIGVGVWLWKRKQAQDAAADAAFRQARIDREPIPGL